VPEQWLTINVGGTKPRHELLEGRDHIVVPAAILAEEVIEGSDGPVFYPGPELTKSTIAWNHRPAVINHPDGDAVACKPQILNTRKVGITLNTRYDDKLRTECWVDVVRCKAIDRSVYERLEEGQQVEASTGLGYDRQFKAGEHKGRRYDKIAVNHRPEHLAILPSGVGAYSIKAGGGLMVTNDRRLPEGVAAVLNRGLQNQMDLSRLMATTANELSYTEVAQRLAELLASAYGEPGKYWDGYLCEVFDGYCVFGNAGKTWRVDYKKTDTDVSLSGDPAEVQRSVEYVPVSNRGKESPMAFDKKAHVDKLIGAGGVWKEGDRDALMAMPDAQLEKVEPVVLKVAPVTPNSAPPAPPAPPPVTTPAPTVPQAQTVQQYIDAAPPGIREVLADGIATNAAEKERLVTIILNAPGNTYTPEQLRDPATTLASLRPIVAFVEALRPPAPGHSPIGPGPVTANYRAAAGAPPVTTPVANGEPGLPRPKMTFANPLSRN
jgi:hypothetical protein